MMKSAAGAALCVAVFSLSPITQSFAQTLEVPEKQSQDNQAKIHVHTYDDGALSAHLKMTDIFGEVIVYMGCGGNASNIIAPLEFGGQGTNSNAGLYYESEGVFMTADVSLVGAFDKEISIFIDSKKMCVGMITKPEFMACTETSSEIAYEEQLRTAFSDVQEQVKSICADLFVANKGKGVGYESVISRFTEPVREGEPSFIKYLDNLGRRTLSHGYSIRDAAFALGLKGP